MARKSRNFDAISVLKYSNKMTHVATGTGGNRGTAELYAYEYAIGQGGYISLRKRVKEFLDGHKIAGAVRTPFYALAQSIFKALIKDGVSKDEINSNLDEYVKKYFVENTTLYNEAKTMVQNVFGIGAQANKENTNPNEIKEEEKTNTNP